MSITGVWYTRALKAEADLAGASERIEGLIANVNMLTLDKERLEAERDALWEAAKLADEAIHKVEWLVSRFDDTYCPWCDGEEPGDEPTHDVWPDDWEYREFHERWEKRGHKPDCLRQRALAALRQKGEGDNA